VGCEYYLELISCELDGEITESERAALTAHLADCDACRRYAAALRAIHEGLAGEAEVPAGFAESVMAKLPAKKKNMIPLRRWGSLAAAAVLVVVLGSTVFAPKGKDAAMAAPMAPAAGEAPAEAAPTEAQAESNEMMMFAAPRAAADEAVAEVAETEAAPLAEEAKAESGLAPHFDAALRYAEEKLPGHWEILAAEDSTVTLRHESGEELRLTVDENGDIHE